jgi:hypothetical protein
VDGDLQPLACTYLEEAFQLFSLPKRDVWRDEHLWCRGDTKLQRREKKGQSHGDQRSSYSAALAEGERACAYFGELAVQFNEQ